MSSRGRLHGSAPGRNQEFLKMRFSNLLRDFYTDIFRNIYRTEVSEGQWATVEYIILQEWFEEFLWTL